MKVQTLTRMNKVAIWDYYHMTTMNGLNGHFNHYVPTKVSVLSLSLNWMLYFEVLMAIVMCAISSLSG